jgi:hypothetical protein
MDIIGFLCVLLGSSTVQLHDSLGIRCACTCSGAGFRSHNGDHAWVCTTKEQRSVVCFFLWAEGINAKDIHNKMIPVYSGMCLSHKTVHNLVANVSLIMKRLKQRYGGG